MTAMKDISLKTLVKITENLYAGMNNEMARPFKEMHTVTPGKETSPCSRFGVSTTLFIPAVEELIRRQIPVPDNVMVVYNEILDIQAGK